MTSSHDSLNDSGAPLTLALDKSLSAEQAFLRLCHLPHVVWFDSAGGIESLARYSFITADPWQILSAEHSRQDALQRLLPVVTWLQQQRNVLDLPFTGGLAGVFSYDLCRTLENVPDHRFDDFPLPWLLVGCYDWALVFDHLTGKNWLISQGWPEVDPSLRYQRAQARLQEVQRWLQASRPLNLPSAKENPAQTFAPQFTTRFPGVTSNFSSVAFRDALQAVVEYIRAGDVFQVNLAQRLLIRDRGSSAARYLSLRRSNRAPFAGYFDGGSWQILSSSPERLIQLRHGEVEARPIKGTCPRTGDLAVDEALARELSLSKKDRAENIMIVDLMRNDLSRVCLDNSVRVSRICDLEPYARVQHLVSVVQGRIQPGLNTLDLLRATFPGGSITGAPKLRAMQIIAELEPTARSFYCGSLGYISCEDRSDFNILIRSMIAQNGWLQVPVGGGITARSDPLAEEKETWDKAAGMLAAFESL